MIKISFWIFSFTILYQQQKWLVIKKNVTTLLIIAEVVQEILSEEMIAVLPVIAGIEIAQEIMSEEKKIHNIKKTKKGEQ